MMPPKVIPYLYLRLVFHHFMSYLCHKRNGSSFGVLHHLLMHLESRESIQKSRVSAYRLYILLRFFCALPKNEFGQ